MEVVLQFPFGISTWTMSASEAQELAEQLYEAADEAESSNGVVYVVLGDSAKTAQEK